MSFNGFPKDGLRFLDDLAVNNNREWFETNKKTFVDTLQKPALDFVVAVGDRLKTLVPDLRYDTSTNGSGSLMRINRDTRFSADKTPYKTNVSGMWWAGAGKKTQVPAFGFQINSEGLRLMTGIFAFDKTQMTAYRAAVADDKRGGELAKILNGLTKTGAYSVNGKHYKKVPSGFAADHPRAELLMYNGLWVSPALISVEQAMSPEVVDVAFGHLKNMAPVQAWLLKVI